MLVHVNAEGHLSQADLSPLVHVCTCTKSTPFDEQRKVMDMQYVHTYIHDIILDFVMKNMQSRSPQVHRHVLISMCVVGNVGMCYRVFPSSHRCSS